MKTIEQIVAYHKAPAMILAYVEWLKGEAYGEDEPMAALDQAILDAQSDDEIRALGAALLYRNERLADAPYRHDGEFFEPALREIAEAIGWAV